MDDREREFRRQMWRDLDSGWTMTAELLAATAVWMAIGWLVDRWLSTEPWLMLTGAVLGFALGFYLLYLRAQEQAMAEEAKRPRL